MARAAGMSAASVQRLRTANDIKPHLSRTFELSNDKQFEEKFWDVIGFISTRQRTRWCCAATRNRNAGAPAHAAGACRWGSAIFPARPMITSATAR
jgi:hypothetical protein